VFDEPVGRHDLDAVGQRAPTRRREQRPGREPVDLIFGESGIGDRFEHGFHRERPEADLLVTRDRAVGEADDRDLTARLESAGHDVPATK
jgi:hypothetical protein